MVYLVIWLLEKKKKKESNRKKGNWECVSWFGPGGGGGVHSSAGSRMGARPEARAAKASVLQRETCLPRSKRREGPRPQAMLRGATSCSFKPCFKRGSCLSWVRCRQRGSEGRALLQTHRTEVWQPNYLIAWTRHQCQQK